MQDKDCEDGDKCTINTCVNNKCQSKPVVSKRHSENCMGHPH